MDSATCSFRHGWYLRCPNYAFWIFYLDFFGIKKDIGLWQRECLICISGYFFAFIKCQHHRVTCLPTDYFGLSWYCRIYCVWSQPRSLLQWLQSCVQLIRKPQSKVTNASDKPIRAACASGTRLLKWSVSDRGCKEALQQWTVWDTLCIFWTLQHVSLSPQIPL